MNRSPRALGRQRSALLLAVILTAFAIVAVLLTQRALAASVGAFVAQLWVSVMDAVLRLLAAMFGG